MGMPHHGMEQVYSYSSKGISQGLNVFTVSKMRNTQHLCELMLSGGFWQPAGSWLSFARLEYTRSWKSNAVVMGVLSMRVALGSVFRTKSVCVCVSVYVCARTHTCTHLCVMIILFKVIRPGV